MRRTDTSAVPRIPTTVKTSSKDVLQNTGLRLSLLRKLYQPIVVTRRKWKGVLERPSAKGLELVNASWESVDQNVCSSRVILDNFEDLTVDEGIQRLGRNKALVA
jgi:hypothetical protein